ncbi:MAG: MFS transporter [Holophaga sp.]|nr:MFS transporter [Holophaga sp.]
MSATHARRRAQLGLLANCCAVFMTVMNALIVNVALEPMQRALGADLSHLQWVVNAYTLSFASCLLMAGMLGDRLGYKRMFNVGLWTFTLGSVICGLSPDLSFLIATRVFQGIGASLLIPNALSLLNRTYEDPAAKAKAVGVWACCSSAGVSAGPLVGGYLVGAFGWRSIFFVNLPFGILAYVLLKVSVEERKAEGELSPFDWTSQALAVSALASLTYAVIEGRARGLHAALLPVAILLAASLLFGFRQRRSTRPLLPRELPRIPAWVNANAVAFLICFVYYGFIFMVSLYFQITRHFSPMVTGLTFLPMTLLQPFLHPFLGRWVAKVGPRTPMALSLFLAFAGLFMASFMGPETSRLCLGLIMLPIGLGSSLGISPALVSMLRATPKENSGVASGIFNTGRQAGALLGVAVLGAFLGSESHFLRGFHVAVLLSSALVFLGILGTLIWTQKGITDQDPGRLGRKGLGQMDGCADAVLTSPVD